MEKIDGCAYFIRKGRAAYNPCPSMETANTVYDSARDVRVSKTNVPLHVGDPEGQDT